MTDKPAKPDAEKLLPCPCCAGTNLAFGGPDYPVYCKKCHLRAIDWDAWNLRPLQPQEQPEQDQGVPFGPGSREPDQQAVPALRASIPDAEGLPDEAQFTEFADEVNAAVRKAAARVFEEYAGPLNDTEKVVATLAGLVTAAGYWCGVWEPALDAQAFHKVLPEQFDEGRKAAFVGESVQ